MPKHKKSTESVKTRATSFYQLPVIKYKEKYYLTTHDLRYFIYNERGYFNTSFSAYMKQKVSIGKEKTTLLASILLRWIKKDKNSIIDPKKYSILSNTVKSKGIVLFEYNEFEKHFKRKLKERIVSEVSTKFHEAMDVFKHLIDINVKWNVKKHAVIIDLDNSTLIMQEGGDDIEDEPYVDMEDVTFYGDNDNNDALNSISVRKENVNNNNISFVSDNNALNISNINNNNNNTVTEDESNNGSMIDAALSTSNALLDNNDFPPMPIEDDHNNNLFKLILKQLENERKKYKNNELLFYSNESLHSICLNIYLSSICKDCKFVESNDKLTNEEKAYIFFLVNKMLIELNENERVWKEEDLKRLKELQTSCWNVVRIYWPEEMKRMSNDQKKNEENVIIVERGLKVKTELIFGRLFQNVMEDLVNIEAELDKL
ncbi:hypothetical protein ABK040_008732 [Willaertia magna]